MPAVQLVGRQGGDGTVLTPMAAKANARKQHTQTYKILKTL